MFLGLFPPPLRDGYFHRLALQIYGYFGKVKGKTLFFQIFYIVKLKKCVSLRCRKARNNRRRRAPVWAINLRRFCLLGSRSRHIQSPSRFFYIQQRFARCPPWARCNAVEQYQQNGSFWFATGFRWEDAVL